LLCDNNCFYDVFWSVRCPIQRVFIEAKQMQRLSFLTVSTRSFPVHFAEKFLKLELFVLSGNNVKMYYCGVQVCIYT